MVDCSNNELLYVITDSRLLMIMQSSRMLVFRTLASIIYVTVRVVQTGDPFVCIVSTAYSGV